MTAPRPPFVDEHDLRIEAPAPVVWEALAAVLAAQPPGTGVYGRLVGADPCGRTGDLLAPGAAVVGFRVAAADPPTAVRLTGRHRFSRYELAFALTVDTGTTVLSAATRAEFPGPHGRAYRALVIDSGVHRQVVRGMLDAVRGRAERDRT